MVSSSDRLSSEKHARTRVAALPERRGRGPAAPAGRAWREHGAGLLQHIVEDVGHAGKRGGVEQPAVLETASGSFGQNRIIGAGPRIIGCYLFVSSVGWANFAVGAWSAAYAACSALQPWVSDCS